MGIFAQQSGSGNDEAGSAVAALQGSVVNKGLLDGRKVALLIGKALNGLEVLAVHLGGQHQAAVDQYAVNNHGAGTALAGAAAFLGTGQVQHIADIL